MKASAFISVALAALLMLPACEPSPTFEGTPLNCTICRKKGPAGSELRFGYQYYLVHRLAKAEGRSASITMAYRSDHLLDSLRQGRIDLLVLPDEDSLATDSLLTWCPADSCGIWVFPAGSQIEADFASDWLRMLRQEPDYPKTRQHYFDIYSPYKRVSADFISPYDSLIRVYADTLGWDWKMLAALIYQESKFHIEVSSPRGASGLMQLVPGTAKNFGCKDWLDPEENLRAGVMMLMSVEKKYRRIAANRDELAKYTLAAYNAGATRIKDCINYARHLGVNVAYWDSVARVIPDMKHEHVAALDTVKLGVFHGDETISYVRTVNGHYQRYRHICP